MLPQRLKTELRDLMELVLCPMLGALGPLRLGHGLLKRLAQWPRLYPASVQRAVDGATRRGWWPATPQAQARWRWQRRLTTLLDHADLYLGLSRSDAWMQHWLDVEGAWPQPGEAAVLCTFHWGAGMWGLRHAHAQGLRPHALVAALQGEHFKGRTVLHAYARLRTATVARALGRPTMDVSGSLRPAIKALRQGEQILAAIDVPSDQVAASETVMLAGLQARVPRGLLRLAVDQKVPVYVYVTGFNPDTGRRFLRIKPMGVQADVPTLVQQVFGELDRLIRESPPAWHFWSEADRFFTDPVALQTPCAAQQGEPS